MKFLLISLLYISVYAFFPWGACEFHLHNEKHVFSDFSNVISKRRKIKNVLEKNHCILEQIGGTCYIAGAKNIFDQKYKELRLPGELSYHSLLVSVFYDRFKNLYYTEDFTAKLKKNKSFEQLMVSISGSGTTKQILDTEKIYQLDSGYYEKFISDIGQDIDKSLKKLRMYLKKNESIADVTQDKTALSMYKQLTGKLDTHYSKLKNIDAVFKDNYTVKTLFSKDQDSTADEVKGLIDSNEKILAVMHSYKHKKVKYNDKNGLISVKLSKENNDSKPISGHAMEILGYTLNRAKKISYFVLANSWGESYGMRGFYYMKKSEFAEIVDRVELLERKVH